MPDSRMPISRDDFITAVDALSVSGGEAIELTKVEADGERAFACGERIRMAREWKGFTIDELALKTGIDKVMLSQAERGEIPLSLGDLVKVAKSLSLRLADVIARGRKPHTVVRNGEGRALNRFGSESEKLAPSTNKFGYSYASLAPNKKGKAMEPFLVTLYPNETLAASSHEGQEFIFVLDGEVEVVLEGESIVLNQGDAIYYDSLDNHLVKAHGASSAKIVAVLTT